MPRYTNNGLGQKVWNWTVLDMKTLKQCEKYNQGVISRRNTHAVKLEKAEKKVKILQQKLKDEENKLYDIRYHQRPKGFDIQMKPQVHRHYETSEIQIFPDEINFYDNIKTRIHIYNQEENKDEILWEMKDGSWMSGCISIPCINGGSEMDESKTYFRTTLFKESSND
jgi:hypothetical protein